MAQRRPVNCGYATSSHVFRPPGHGAGGVRAGASRPGAREATLNPFISLILFRVSLASHQIIYRPTYYAGGRVEQEDLLFLGALYEVV